LVHIDQHLPNGLDEHVFAWLKNTGIAELIAIDAEAWDCVTVALLYLLVQGVLSATTILEGLVYPLWERVLDPPEGGETTVQLPELYLRAAHDIFARLLLREDGTDDGVPPLDFIEFQRVHTRRRDVFQEPHLSVLVSNIPTLVFLENSQIIPPDLRQLSAAIRHAICDVTEFRQGIYRDLNAVRDAFERSLQYNTLDESFVEPLMDALRLILNVARTGTHVCAISIDHITNRRLQILRLWAHLSGWTPLPFSVRGS
jgi:mediator of RNA polymerase II transcription subunit 12, fungi type